MLPHVVVANIFWYEGHHDVLHGMHSPLVAFCLTFRSFWMCLIVYVPIIYLNNVFLQKAMTGVALNASLNILLIFNICQCLLIISLIFGKARLYVAENGITFFCFTLVLLSRADHFRLSTFSIWF